MQAYPVVEEARYRLALNGSEIAVVHCTPEALREFTVGYLFSRGILQPCTSIGSLSICNDLGIISVSIPGVDASEFIQQKLVGSGCSAAVSEENLLYALPETSLALSMEELKAQAATMFRGAEKYKETGGIHCARLVMYDEGASEKTSVVFEDVGRHNALDKVIGWALLNNADFSRCAVFTSGRIAYDMADKVLHAGVPVLVSRSIPTSFALELARKTELTLVGRIEKPEPLVYSGAKRIVF